MFTELHREGRGRKETEVARRIKGGFRRRDTDPASNQFPKCSPQPRTQRDPQSCVEKGEGHTSEGQEWGKDSGKIK